MRWRGLILALALLLAGPALARDGLATLVADRVEIRNRSELVASGNVEVFHKGQRLRASRVVYDNTARTLRIEGPIRLTDASGTLVLASEAELGAELRDGVLRSARVMLDDQLQIAAAQVNRVGGRYTVAHRAIASSCQVCADRPVPLWEIRAQRIVHDQDARQIWFDNPQFRLGGVPVLWLPYLRMPDPTLKRATGFLVPRFSSSSKQGFGVAVPYFIRLGDHRDLTLAPYLSTNSVASLGFRYRQAFATGQAALTGALSFDSINPGLTGARGFARLDGQFALPRDFVLRLDLQGASDRFYLRDYSLGNEDRIESRILVERVRRDEYIGARLLAWQSLRADLTDEVTPLATDVIWQRRLSPRFLGGLLELEARAGAQLGTVAYPGTQSVMARARLAADWRQDIVLAGGIVLGFGAGLRTDLHVVPLGGGASRIATHALPHALAEVRWPLRRVTRSGATEVLEPVAQLVWSGADTTPPLPNEDSALVSFDEGNLFAPSRFSGIDRREGGSRLNLGLGWTRLDAQGRQIALHAGRIWRIDGTGQFTATSGLSGRWSDWLVGAHVDLPDNWSVMARAAFDDAFTVSRAEGRARLTRPTYDLGGAVLWAAVDPAENRITPTAEWQMDGSYALTPNWRVRAGARLDLSSGQVTHASGGLLYANECLRLDLSLSRRFSSSNNVAPNTEFGLTFDLAGFGGSRTPGPARRRCTG
jgi:LPS-assembly protein